MCGNEPCAHEREFAGTQRDTLTSFIKTSGALTAMTAERDEVRAALARVEALHVRDGNDPDPDTEWCAACGFGWPCSTIRALTEWNA